MDLARGSSKSTIILQAYHAERTVQTWALYKGRDNLCLIDSKRLSRGYLRRLFHLLKHYTMESWEVESSPRHESSTQSHPKLVPLFYHPIVSDSSDWSRRLLLVDPELMSIFLHVEVVDGIKKPRRSMWQSRSLFYTNITADMISSLNHGMDMAPHMDGDCRKERLLVQRCGLFRSFVADYLLDSHFV